MNGINITTGLDIKADANKLYSDAVGTYAKYKEDKRYNKEAYEELLEKYGELKSDLENMRNRINDLIDEAQSDKLPDENDVKSIDALAELLGAKNQDGSLDMQKLTQLNETFGEK
jgi:hypothetical protein